LKPAGFVVLDCVTVSDALVGPPPIPIVGAFAYWFTPLVVSVTSTGFGVVPVLVVAGIAVYDTLL
jgi:hypothetical protein